MSLRPPSRRVTPFTTSYSSEDSVSNSDHSLSVMMSNGSVVSNASNGSGIGQYNDDSSSMIYRVSSMDSSSFCISESGADYSWVCPKCSYHNVDSHNERCALCGSEDQSHFMEKTQKKKEQKKKWLSLGTTPSESIDEEDEEEELEAELYATPIIPPTPTPSLNPPRQLQSQSSSRSRSVVSTSSAQSEPPLIRPARQEDDADIDDMPIKPLSGRKPSLPTTTTSTSTGSKLNNSGNGDGSSSSSVGGAPRSYIGVPAAGASFTSYIRQHHMKPTTTSPIYGKQSNSHPHDDDDDDTQTDNQSNVTNHSRATVKMSNVERNRRLSREMASSPASLSSSSPPPPPSENATTPTMSNSSVRNLDNTDNQINDIPLVITNNKKNKNKKGNRQSRSVTEHEHQDDLSSSSSTRSGLSQYNSAPPRIPRCPSIVEEPADVEQSSSYLPASMASTTNRKFSSSSRSSSSSSSSAATAASSSSKKLARSSSPLVPPSLSPPSSSSSIQGHPESTGSILLPPRRKESSAIMSKSSPLPPSHSSMVEDTSPPQRRQQQQPLPPPLMSSSFAGGGAPPAPPSMVRSQSRKDNGTSGLKSKGSIGKSHHTTQTHYSSFASTTGHAEEDDDYADAVNVDAMNVVGNGVHVLPVLDLTDVAERGQMQSSSSSPVESPVISVGNRGLNMIHNNHDHNGNGFENEIIVTTGAVHRQPSRDDSLRKQRRVFLSLVIAGVVMVALSIILFAVFFSGRNNNKTIVTTYTPTDAPNAGSNNNSSGIDLIDPTSSPTPAPTGDSITDLGDGTEDLIIGDKPDKLPTDGSAPVDQPGDSGVPKDDESENVSNAPEGASAIGVSPGKG